MVKGLTDKQLIGIRSRVIPAWLKATLEDDDDRFIVVVGREGTGKTTLAVIVANLIHDQRKKLYGIDKPFDMRVQVHYELQSLVHSVIKNPDREKGDVHILDEAIFIASNRETQTKDAKHFHNFMTAIRSKNQIIIIVLPRLQYLDKAYQHRAHGYLRVVGRGHAWAYDRSEKERKVRWIFYSRKFKWLRPSLHQEKYPSVQQLYGEKYWSFYNELKDKAIEKLTDKIFEDDKKTKVDNKYVRPKVIREMFGVSKFVIRKWYTDDRIDKLRDGHGYLFNVASVKAQLSTGLTAYTQKKPTIEQRKGNHDEKR
jgi:hypothetical protein